jgi:hypothetical protein
MRKIKTLVRYLLCLVLGALIFDASNLVQAQSFVLNGDFSSFSSSGGRHPTYSFPGWSSQGPYMGVNVGGGYLSGNSVYLGAGLGDNGTVGDRFTQSIATVAGSSYALSFYITGAGGVSNDSDVYLDWNGSRALNLPDTSFSGWTLENVDVTASSSETSFDIGTYSPNSYDISNVSILAIPEPSQYAFFIVLAAAGFITSRRISARVSQL